MRARRVMAAWAAAAFAAAVAFAVGGCTATTGDSAATSSAASPERTAPRPSTQGTASPTPAAGGLQHVVVIMEENKPATRIVGNPDAPYFNQLLAENAHASRYDAITHPSLPNYLALTSGTTGGITTDCNPPGGSCLVTDPNIADSLRAAGSSWRMYAEGMPAPCSLDNSGRYAVKHNPFLYYPSVTGSSSYCAQHDVPYTEFAADLASASTLPAFSMISPDLCNDMHSCPIATGDQWLSRVVPQILGSPAFTTQRSLLVVTFDEGDSSDNRVACVFAGSAARRGAVSDVPYTHYSLLRTIEDGLGLPSLGMSSAAKPMTDLLDH